MNIFRYTFYFWVFFFINYTGIYAQKHSYNGYTLPPNDTIRALFVFAEMSNAPPCYNNFSHWESGQLPDAALNNELINQSIENPDSIKGWFTKYYYQMSFGNLIFLGDYLSHPVIIDYDSIKAKGEPSILEYLSRMPEDSLKTRYGTPIRDFDNIKGKPYLPKEKIKDNKIDLLIVVWRKNHKAHCDKCGYTLTGGTNKNIASMSGSNIFIMCNSLTKTNIRHEINHSFLGGNSFHSAGGGAGTRTHMGNYGGYGLLSLSNSFGYIASPWDRRRLDWKHPDNSYSISARNEQYNEIDADLQYKKPSENDSTIFILRDYITYGDAIRIKLPYINTLHPSVNPQWLWIVNHQKKEGNFDLRPICKKGIYAHVQIGTESFTQFRPYTNYFIPLSSFGNYDMTYEDIPDERWKTAIIDTRLENSFTGNSNKISPQYDYKEPFDFIDKRENASIKGIVIDGDTLPESMFSYQTFPAFGTSFDSFNTGDEISISTNPSPTPILTYNSSKSSTQRRRNRVSKTDNRHIQLNGINISIIEEKKNGNIIIKIDWNDTIIDNNVRWCGQIELFENIYLANKKRIYLDYGRTPQLPSPLATIDGENIYSDTTVLHCTKGSSIKLGENAILELDNYSKLIVDSLSQLHLYKGSTIKVNRDCEIKIHPNASIIIHKGARILCDKGATVAIPKEADIKNNFGARIITDIDIPLPFPVEINDKEAIKKGRFR